MEDLACEDEDEDEHEDEDEDEHEDEQDLNLLYLPLLPLRQGVLFLSILVGSSVACVVFCVVSSVVSFEASVVEVF
jgi:hypothetical protein